MSGLKEESAGAVAVGADRRRLPDRRRGGVRAGLASLELRRRHAVRRASEVQRARYGDSYPASAVALALSVILLSSTDALLTMQILARGGQELNPLMAVLIDLDHRLFFGVKYALTALCVLVLLVFAHARLFRRVRVMHVLASISALYAGLVAYEILVLVATR